MQITQNKLKYCANLHKNKLKIFKNIHKNELKGGITTFIH
jgi:hypothetical protein